MASAAWSHWLYDQHIDAEYEQSAAYARGLDVGTATLADQTWPARIRGLKNFGRIRRDLRGTLRALITMHDRSGSEMSRYKRRA